MPRVPDEDDYRKAYTVYNRGSSELSEGLLAEPINVGPQEKADDDDSLPPLSRDQKVKWFLLVLLQLLGTLAGTIPGPLMIYLQSAYFNDGHPCISKTETDTLGCKNALSTISFVSGWFQAGSGLLAFFLSPAIGKLSDSFGRRKILLVCFSYNLLGNGVLFLGQTPLMDKAPWLWIYFGLNVVNLWGGVSSAYLADIMPPEWRSIAFGINASIFGVGNTIGPLIDLIPFKGARIDVQAAAPRVHGCNHERVLLNREPLSYACALGLSMADCFPPPPCLCALSSATLCAAPNGGINYVMPFAITFGLNVAMFLIAFCFLTETLPMHLRVPFTFGSVNSIKQLGILWNGPKGISNRFIFRR
jgi:MFS family permease